MGEKSYQGAASHYLELLEAGVKIGEWQGHRPLEQLEDQGGCKIAAGEWPGNTLHAKVVLFDESEFLIGSNNLNHQSLHHNSEVMVYVRDAQLAHEIAQIFSDVEQTENFANCGGKRLAIAQPQVEWIDEARAKQLWAQHQISGPTFSYPNGN